MNAKPWRLSSMYAADADADADADDGAAPSGIPGGRRRAGSLPCPVLHAPTGARDRQSGRGEMTDRPTDRPTDRCARAIKGWHYKRYST
jgi:hypothetical protein